MDFLHIRIPNLAGDNDRERQILCIHHQFRIDVDPIMGEHILYATFYRLQADGTVDGITLELVNPKSKQQLTDALSFALRPGDIVSVESTPRTRAKVFFDRIFRITLGLYFTPDTLWRNDD